MIVQTHSLTKRFSGFTAIDRVTLSIEENEIRSIIGPNGAGKTTLFNLLMGVLQPTEGTIEFDGQDITDEPLHRRPYFGISRSYQVTNVYQSMTVFENLQTAVGLFHGNYYDTMTPLDQQRDVTDKAEALIDRLGFADERETAASALSHGEKRRLEVGMALAAEPKLLLLDEPTAGMGSKEAEETIEFIGGLAEELTVALIEHNIEGVMQVSDVISVLERGQIIAEGDPDSIRQNERVQSAYLGGATHA